MVLALTLGTRVALTVQMASVGALGPAMLADRSTHLGYTGLGGLIGIYMLPGAFVALPAGWLTSLLGERRIPLAGLALATAGGFGVAASPNSGTLFAARLLAGTGAAFLTVIISAMIMARFHGKPLAAAMGGFLAAHPLALGLSLLALPYLASAVSWRGAMLASALLCLLMLVAVPFVFEKVTPPHSLAEVGAHYEEQRRRTLLGQFELVLALTAALAWVGYNSGAVVLNGFAPVALVVRGFSSETAGALASLVVWGSVPLVLLGGPVAERAGRPLLASAICLTAMAVVMLALAGRVGPPAVTLLASGLLWSVSATTLMTIPARAPTPQIRAFGMGVYWTVYYAGVALLPPIAGWAADVTAGGSSLALAVGAGFIVTSIAAVGACGLLLGKQ